MYQLVQFIRHKIPFFWSLIESINATIFQLKYGKALKNLPSLLSEFNNSSISFKLAEIDDASLLVDFFRKQPEEAFKFFKPHGFDRESILKLVKNTSFIMILAQVDSKIVGYAFLRCFFNGKSFRGKIVDIDYRGRGLAKQFGVQTTKIALKLGIDLYGTVSKSNISSMASSKSSNDIKIIKELPDDYLLIQYLSKL